MMLHDDARIRTTDEVAPAGRIEVDGLTRRFADTTMLNSTTRALLFNNTGLLAALPKPRGREVGKAGPKPAARSAEQ